MVLAIGGGSSRADVQSLVVVRPVTVAALAFGLWRVDVATIRTYRFLYSLLAASFIAVLVYLIPLPPSIWRVLPGHERFFVFAQDAGSGDVWRPLTLVPWATWNALYALFGPAAVLLLSSQLRQTEFRALLKLMLILGFCAAVLGLFQAVSGAGMGFYIYQRTQPGAVVGLFANRNHEALLIAMLLPALAALVTTGDEATRYARSLLALVGAFALLPLLLLTGSRAGLGIVVLAIVGVVEIYRSSPGWSSAVPRRLTRLTASVVGFGVAILLASALWFTRADAITRLFNDPIEDLRFQFWKPVLAMVRAYFPTGAGWGSFVEVYQIDEPRSLLAINYLNHAHNDWLEVAMCGGIIGVTLLALALGLWAWSIGQLFRMRSKSDETISLARLGGVWTGLAGLMSVSDYPLRVPFLAAYFVIGAVWLSAGLTRSDGAPNKQNATVGRVQRKQD